MKYGLIGEKLGHSFSKEIHEVLGNHSYELKEVSRDNFESFVKKGDFAGINVTIPYKEAIIPFLYYMDEAAESIGAVNTVINTEGHLFGFNTDFYGMMAMICRANIDLYQKKVAILGTGGTSKTALAVSKKLGAKEVFKVSRNISDHAITYKELYENNSDTEIIINTTPVGMYPAADGLPIDIAAFPKLSGVIDVIYNPLRTPLVVEAMKRGIPATGGLYMLVSQAVKASEIFTDSKYESEVEEKIYQKILRDKENVALIGMPSSGKTTVGKLISEMYGFTFIDTDEEIVKRCGMDIPSIFKTHGENFFRDIEEEVIKDVSRESRCVISTGGGVILRQNNINALRRNSRIVFLDRPLDLLTPTQDRPLSSDDQKLRLMYEERYPVYSSVCDEKVDAGLTPEDIANEIIRRVKE